MDLLLAIALFVGGLVLVVYFAEKLVEGVVGTARGFGVSAFVISVVFLGFDPENLAVGSAGAYEGVFGIALGSVIGAAMVAMALAFGITALLSPLHFAEAPRRVLAVAPIAAGLAAALAYDGTLSRIDGGVLLGTYALSIGYLYWLGRRGVRVEPGGEVAEVLEEEEEEGAPPSRWKAAGWMLLSLAAIVAGSEMLVTGSETLIGALGLTDTAFGMTILAFLVSIEELARELPAALKGHPEITFGNVVGSILAFFLFNAGVIALVRPITVAEPVRLFHFPVALATLALVTLLVAFRRVPRWAGALLVLAYAAFVAGTYLDWGLPLG